MLACDGDCRAVERSVRQWSPRSECAMSVALVVRWHAVAHDAVKLKASGDRHGDTRR